MARHCFSTVVAPGMEQETKLLLESIERNTAEPEVYVFAAESELDRIDDELLTEIDSDYNLVVGELPCPDYPMSAGSAALEAASKHSDVEWLIFLDTDTVVLGDLQRGLPSCCNTELIVKPEDKAEYWVRDESESEWRDIFDKFGFDYPENRSVRTTVDDVETVVPYYNSGVVVTRNNDFPERYLELTEKVYEYTGDRFSDQISLALLASEYELDEASENWNYPLFDRLSIKEGALIVHYHTFPDLLRASLFTTSNLELPFSKSDIIRERPELAVKTSYNIFRKLGGERIVG